MSQIGRCILVADGNPRAGILLYRLKFWQSKTRIEKEGHRWVANSAVAWSGDTGLSVKAIRNAIDLLRSKGLIVVHKAMWNGSPTLHLRIPGDALQKLHIAKTSVK